MAGARPPVSVLIAAHIKAQPRRAAVLAILFLVMLGVYARMYLRSYSPGSVSADQVAATPTIPDAASPAPGPAERVTIQMPARRKLSRDPFRVNLSDYPLHDREEEAGHPPESMTLEDEAIRRKAERLPLQSIMVGDDGMAVACIGGRMIREGEEIEGLTVTKVEATRVHLEREGFHLVLKLR